MAYRWLRGPIGPGWLQYIADYVTPEVPTPGGGGGGGSQVVRTGISVGQYGGYTAPTPAIPTEDLFRKDKELDIAIAIAMLLE